MFVNLCLKHCIGWDKILEDDYFNGGSGLITQSKVIGKKNPTLATLPLDPL